MKNIKYILGFFLSLALVTSCQDDDYVFGELVTPSNVSISAQIVGADADNPNGDGSGFVNFETTSENAITYSYNFGDGTDVAVSATGNISHRFSVTGLNSYVVTVIASGTGGISSTSTINVEVFSSFEDQEARDFLSGGLGNSKTWYWAADKVGNIGLGPNNPRPGNEHTYSQYFTADPWLSDKLCMYDAEFVFTQNSDGGLTMEQTVKRAYTPGDFAASIGVAGDTCHGIAVAPTLVGVKNVSMSPSSSTATIDGDYRGTTLNFSDGGFMSWYVAVFSVEIIEITESTLFVRMTDSSNSDFAWYCRYQTDNPND
ncbi:MAG: PKD domain-containing protein [Flavobacteriaceae bacterium]|nr:PKD domain-containing protein [Flavobacteriaceae bacterium]